MTRMRTHKAAFAHVSNKSAQSDELSWAALGLLTYCLSMPEDWEFHPKTIWKEGKGGRDQIYRLFNELIEAGRCIRIKEENKNPSMKHLPGKVFYEIFDDVEDCKSRVIELSKTEKFLEYKEEFKKCLRLPGNWDPNNRDPRNQDIYKETSYTKKQAIQRNNNKQGATAPNPVVVVPSFIQEIEDLNDEEKLILAAFPEERVKLAIEFNKKEKPTHSKIQQMRWHCQQEIPPKPSKTSHKNNLYDYCVDYFRSNTSKSCEVQIHKDCIYFIPTQGASTNPIEIKFNQEGCTESIKKMCFHYSFVKAKKRIQ